MQTEFKVQKVSHYYEREVIEGKKGNIHVANSECRSHLCHGA